MIFILEKGEYGVAGLILDKDLMEFFYGVLKEFLSGVLKVYPLH